MAEAFALSDTSKLGKLHDTGAGHLTFPRNCSRRRASYFIVTVASVHQSIMPAISPSKPYRIGRSRTGLGLFATRPIKKGTKIIRYFGPLLDCRKKKDDAIENKYLFELNNRWTIDGSVRENVARYINHACKPNAESDVKPRKRKVFIRAIKNIEPGEEISYDYGTDYFKAYLKPIGCKCDACEKKRRKKRAEARAERQREREKVERKARRLAEKLARANEKLKKLNGKSMRTNGNGANGNGIHANGQAKRANGKYANGKFTNGKYTNGHDRASA
jgi:uncharacterized protein